MIASGVMKVGVDFAGADVFHVEAEVGAAAGGCLAEPGAQQQAPSIHARDGHFTLRLQHQECARDRSEDFDGQLSDGLFGVKGQGIDQSAAARDERNGQYGFRRVNRGLPVRSLNIDQGKSGSGR